MNISLKHRGNFSNLERFLNKILKKDYLNIMHKYGIEGVQALSSATPIDSGLTASSWYYDIKENGDTSTLTWYNTNINDGHNIAILIQYGHGIPTGGFVNGTDYINPALEPIFKKLIHELTALTQK